MDIAYLFFEGVNMSLVIFNRTWEHPLLESGARHFPPGGGVIGGPYTIFGVIGQVAYHSIEILKRRRMILYLSRYLDLLQNGKGSKFKFGFH